jgi:transcriptional regulator with XRE-family HTH domain
MDGLKTEQGEHREFCRRLQQLMATYHWKNEDVAIRIGFSPSTVSRIVTGVQDATRAQIMRFAKAFDVAPSALLDTPPPLCGQSPAMQLKLMAIERALQQLLEEVMTLTASAIAS